MIRKEKQYLNFEALEGNYKYDFDKGEWDKTPPECLHFPHSLRHTSADYFVGWFIHDMCGKNEFWTDNVKHPSNRHWLRFMDMLINSGHRHLCVFRYYEVSYDVLCDHFSDFIKDHAHKFVENSESHLIYDNWTTIPNVGVVLNGVETDHEYVELRQVLSTSSSQYGLLDLVRKHAPKREAAIKNIDAWHFSSLFNLCSNARYSQYIDTILYWYFKLQPVFSIWNADVCDVLREYFYRCHYLKVEPRKDSNFLKLLEDIDKNYQVAKTTRNKEKLQEVYTPLLDTLAFEDDICKVVIPKSEEDFKNEGTQQRNCVYTNYYPNIVDEDATNPPIIVFIRYKDNLDKSLITAEINRNHIHDGQCDYHYINQALTKGNEDIEDDYLLDFIRAYDKHLVSAWGEAPIGECGEVVLPF